ncbi:MAG: hypothetical protein M1838_003362 [Thelocarpon superellum]|nr:MAG: hypothetical protein M1838_003362 [Thelocarpon superellum]
MEAYNRRRAIDPTLQPLADPPLLHLNTPSSILKRKDPPVDLEEENDRPAQRQETSSLGPGSQFTTTNGYAAVSDGDSYIPAEASIFSGKPGKPHACDMPECAGRDPFPRLSEYRKHMDRHRRPYRCEYADCGAPPFGDMGGLYRHLREVHRVREGDRAVTEYFCPEKQCERHKRGFPRRWNLTEHQRRVHGYTKWKNVSTQDHDAEDLKRSDSAFSTSSSINARSSSHVSPVSDTPQALHNPNGETSSH